MKGGSWILCALLFSELVAKILLKYENVPCEYQWYDIGVANSGINSDDSFKKKDWSEQHLVRETPSPLLHSLSGRQLVWLGVAPS